MGRCQGLYLGEGAGEQTVMDSGRGEAIERDLEVENCEMERRGGK